MLLLTIIAAGRVETLFTEETKVQRGYKCHAYGMEPLCRGTMFGPQIRLILESQFSLSVPLLNLKQRRETYEQRKG